ncbi:MAG: metallopeptidase family protein, partial [Devosia sp.]
MTNQWTDRTAPSLDDFEEMAAAAFDSLPDEFKALAGNVPCAVADFPDEETMTEMELETEFDILGLFRGVGLPQGGATPFTGQMPNQPRWVRGMVSAIGRILVSPLNLIERRRVAASIRVVFAAKPAVGVSDRLAAR